MQNQSLPYENLPVLMQILKESFAGDNQSVQRATVTLQTMANDPMMFLNSLMRIIIMEKTDTETIQIKTAAVLGLTRCLLDMMKENKVPTEQRNIIIEAVIGAMFSDHVTLPMKVNLQYFLIYLYTVDVGSEMTNKGLNLVKQKLTSSNIHDYPPAFLVLQAVINTAQAPQESVASWFEELREPLVNIGGGLARGIMMEVQGLAGTAPSQEKVTGIFVGLKIFKMWILTIHEFIKLLGLNNAKKKLKPTYLKVVLVQEHLVQVLSALIMLTIPSDKQIKDCIFSTSGLTELDQLLNTVKTSALKSFSKVLDLMDDLNTIVAPADNKFFVFSKNYYLHTFLSSLVIFFRNENLNVEALQNDKDLTELIVEAITFLEKMANFPDLYPTFSAYIKHLIVDVCFSLIRTTNSEIEQFKTDPAQFVEDALDVVGPQKSQTAKAQAAKFLTKLCSNLDGALSYAALVALCMIDYSMVSDNRSEIPNTHKDLTEYINSIIIAKTDPNVRVESCLVILTILNNQIGKRSDLVVLIEGLLTNYSQFFLGAESTALTKARVCLLLASYVHILFRKDDQKEAYTLHLRFLLECAGLEGEEYSSLVEQANTALHSMFEREYLTAALAPYVCDFLEKLTQFILYVKTHKMFDIIHEIVTTYDTQILEKPELLVNLTEALVKRWEHEFQITRKDPKANKIVLNKIWNVIRAIGGKEEYVQPLQEEIEKRLLVMFKYLDINENLHFDEDILNYVASVTKITKRVSAAIWEVFQKFPSIFERYQGLLTHLFPPLNQIVIHGQEVINSDETAIQTLIDIGIQALNPSHHTADESNFSEGAVLLQLILQYVHPISQERLRKILLASYDKLQGAENDFLKARLGDVFLCAFLQNFEATQEILSSVQVLQHVMDLFLKDVLVFETQAYDRKLLVIGLSSLLPQTNLSPEIENRLPEIFDVIVSFLRYVGYMEQRDAKRNFGFLEESDSDAEDRKTSNKDILLRFLDNKERLAATIDDADGDSDKDDDDDEDDEEPYVFGKTEANSVIRNLETGLKSKDEFVCFQEAIHLMKERRPDVFRMLVESLPEKKQKFLNEVLQSRRIGTEQEGKTQARKIVRVGAKKIAQIQAGNNPGNQ